MTHQEAGKFLQKLIFKNDFSAEAKQPFHQKPETAAKLNEPHGSTKHMK